MIWGPICVLSSPFFWPSSFLTSLRVSSKLMGVKFLHCWGFWKLLCWVFETFFPAFSRGSHHLAGLTSSCFSDCRLLMISWRSQLNWTETHWLWLQSLCFFGGSLFFLSFLTFLSFFGSWWRGHYICIRLSSKLISWLVDEKNKWMHFGLSTGRNWYTFGFL